MRFFYSMGLLLISSYTSFADPPRALRALRARECVYKPISNSGMITCQIKKPTAVVWKKQKQLRGCTLYEGQVYRGTCFLVPFKEDKRKRRNWCYMQFEGGQRAEFLRAIEELGPDGTWEKTDKRVDCGGES